MDFLTGVNYWASNAGVKTFADFNEQVIDRDFAILKEHGVNTIRVFPLLSDFMPVERSHAKTDTFALRKNGVPLEYLSFKSGLCEEACEKFKTLLRLAKNYGFKVIVALITGWMSGKKFVPPFFEDRNPITDKECIVYECKFIKDFISVFKYYDNIIAWELGNECNALSLDSPKADNELWLTAISQAIKSSDGSRPIFSGMHGLSANGKWSLQALSELVDVQTTHPYPLFTPYCSKEELNSMRACLHAPAESEYYLGISNSPCIVEEVGTLGPMVCSGDTSGEYLEKAYASSFASGAKGFLWWCAFDQDELDFPPYDTFAVEQNLGLFKSDLTPKQTALKLKSVAKFFEGINGFVPQKDVCVILTNEQDEWAISYASYVLALQSGRYATYQFENQPLKDYPYYVLPSIKSLTGIPKSLYKELVKKVEEGATLLISYDGGYLSNFEYLTGLECYGREEVNECVSFEISGNKAEINRTTKLLLKPTTAEILVDNGGVILSKNQVGKGYVYFLNAPLETAFTNMYYPTNSNLYTIYETVFKKGGRIISENKNVAVFNGDKKAVIVNFSKENSFRITGCNKITKILNANYNNGVITMEKSYAYIEYEE
ncbi:MAG: cellulase family glycosylhydrolase [Clostridia bacterium]|nr:cellulase family glycosylhydrolase [Clostridia bacterium]